jgi:hypothetical protein
VSTFLIFQGISLSLAMSSQQSTERSRDLTKPEDVQEYLKECQDGQFAAYSVEILFGGFANYTFRAWLERPYEKKIDDSIPIQSASVIVKYATGYAAASGGTIPLDLDRTVSSFAKQRTLLELDTGHRGCGFAISVAIIAPGRYQD